MNGERGAGCTYEPWQPSHRTRTGSTNALPVFRHGDSASGLPSVCTLPSQAPTNGFPFSEPLTHPPLDIPLLTWSNSAESTPSILPHHVHGEVVPGPSSDTSIVWNTHDTTECVPRLPVSSFTVLPSIHSRAVPQILQVPLSLISPERVQVSPVAGGDLDMTLYVPFRLLNSHWFIV